MTSSMYVTIRYWSQPAIVRRFIGSAYKFKRCKRDLSLYRKTMKPTYAYSLCETVLYAFNGLDIVDGRERPDNC